MTKTQCSECRYYFAAPVAATALLCPDCAAEGTRPAGGLTERAARRSRLINARNSDTDKLSACSTTRRVTSPVWQPNALAIAATL
jgi:hypothetical protein